MTQGGQGSLYNAEKLLESLFSRCDEDAGYAIAVYSICLVLMRRLSLSQPVALRRSWALELYKLADSLAGSGTPNEPHGDGQN